MSQFVYVLEDKNTHLLKIGISVDPEFRAKQVDKDFGCTAALVGVLEVQDARKTEQFIHGMLSDCRVVGEWFEVTERKKGYLLTYFTDKLVKKRDPIKPRPKSIPYHAGVTWDELEAEIRVRAKAQPRGFAAALAEALQTDKSAVSQFLAGRRPIPREQIHVVLDALGLELMLQPKPNL